MKTVLTCFALLAMASPVFAVDGVNEINQARALAGGVTPGDLPGFPVSISVSGSYRLTGNLEVAGQPSPENVTAISISADNVTIDLNGFGIIGPSTCSGIPPICAPCGAGSGIFASAKRDIRVGNGMVRGMGNVGILLGRAARVEKVHVVSNCNNGLSLGFDSRVDSCNAESNGGDGIKLSGGSGSGILTNNLAQRNGGDGIECIGRGCVVQGNAADENGVNGFLLGSSSILTHNRAHSNLQHGYHVLGNSVAIGNTAISNGGFGLVANDTSTAYTNNVFTGNTAGQVSNVTEIGTNFCGNNTTCP